MQRKSQSKSKNKGIKHPQALSYPARLNRFISNAGICSRRDADVLIAEGKITMNGKIVTQLGVKVERTDEVKCRGKVIKPEHFVYVLLNKPKNYISTMDDPEKRKTVMELVKGACDERIYPVGRLDRNTMGLLLFTNDGVMSQKLTHPSHKIKKIYQVELDKPITSAHFNQILDGVDLEDGKAFVDQLSVLTVDKKSVGVQIHIGKNRIVRRIFENFGYEVMKLDRTMYGSLTKKDLPKGKWRTLTDKEVILLKNLS